MSLTIASARWNDDEFLRAVDTCELPLSCFRHGDHLRHTWLYLHRQSFADALNSVRRAIKQLAEFHGVSHIFHETQTTAWVTLLGTHREATFGEFIAENEGRLSAGLLEEFWSPECLKTDAARTGWVPPDRAPLPG
jgi:hypothetical protein